MARALHKTPGHVYKMDYWDFQDVLKDLYKVPDISEGFYLYFMKPKPQKIELGEGANRLKAISEAEQLCRQMTGK